jgi:zinc protease
MRRETVAGIDLITIDMPIEGVVSFVGSFAAGEALSPIDRPMLAGLTAAMLDKGSTGKDRFAIAELLNTLGANIDFTADDYNLSFSGRFLRPDAGAVLELLAKQLREPAFNPDVFETVRSRQEANILQAVDNTDYRASSQISRMLYPMAHPNRSEELNALLADLKRTSIEDLRNFHREFYGSESMRLVFAGDIDFEQIKAAVANGFDGWAGGVPYPDNFPAQLENASEQERIYISDKTSVSVHYGYNTGLKRSQDKYLPFMLGNYILGGSFNSRLMSEVRKKLGLTYAIRSYHEGDLLSPGNWALTASFSPDMLDKGLEATEKVLQHWHANGVSEQETEAAIETLTGAYLVGLSTTNRVAAQVHSFLLRGMEPEYIDEYPVKLRQLTSEQVNQAIKKYLDPSSVKLVIAGSLHKVASPMNSPQNTVSVRLDTPNPGWRIQIEKIYRSGENLMVISRLSQSEKIAAQVITAVADSAEIPNDLDLPIRHYIVGKTWNWGDTSNYTFIDSMDAFGTALEESELIYSN